MKRLNTKKGFTIIEVIFMMVVLAIILPTLPLLQFKSSSAIQLLQDTKYYSNGYSQVNLVINKLWDNNNSTDLINTGKYYVLNTDATTNQNDLLNCTDNYRNGNYKAKNRRKCSKNGIASAIGTDTGENNINFNFNDIDDFNNLTYRIIPKDLITPELEAEINTVLPVGETTYEWLQKILSEPFDETNVAGSIATIVAKYPTLTTNLATKWITILPTTQVQVQVDYIDYSTGVVAGVEEINTNIVNVANTTDIKRVTITVTDLKDKNINTRNEYTYRYYATNIGTDIPLVKVNN